MVLTNAERQARYRQRLKEAADPNRSAYEMDVMRQQIAALERALNETRKHIGLAQIQLPKSAYNPHR
jgi:hypothetical protein